MREPEKFIAAIVKATEKGELFSRIRMQKIVYLLQKLGLEDAQGFDFSYHHYGPYSRDVDSAEWFAGAFDLVREERRNRQSDGASYSVFLLNRDKEQEVPELEDVFAGLVGRLAEEKITVLELSATAHWLAEEEKVDDWREEIRRRKTWKVEDGRLEKHLNC